MSKVSKPSKNRPALRAEGGLGVIGSVFAMILSWVPPLPALRQPEPTRRKSKVLASACAAKAPSVAPQLRVSSHSVSLPFSRPPCKWRIAGGKARAVGDAINAGFGYLEVKCLGCNTHQTVALGIVRRPMTTPVHELERYIGARSIGRGEICAKRQPGLRARVSGRVISVCLVG